ncbi:MAG: cupin domain-containing protein [Gemmatimonadales bacterium]
MSSLNHAVTGNALQFDLENEIQVVRNELANGEARAGRTLVKDGPLRVTLVAVRAGGGLHEHTARGPITIQVLEGTIEVDALANRRTLHRGALLALDAGIAHAVTSTAGAVFLLTVQHTA